LSYCAHPEPGDYADLPGRLDAAGPKSGDDTQVRELFEAMRQVAETGHGPEQQVPSMGCSIKWRNNE